jgi:hypothetical protein
MEREPAAYISLLSAFLVLLGAFGIALTEGKIQAIMGLATALLPIVMGLAIRRNVYSPASAQTALNMPPDSNMTLLNNVLDAGVKVLPGDTKVEIVQAVREAQEAQS